MDLSNLLNNNQPQPTEPVTPPASPAEPVPVPPPAAPVMPVTPPPAPVVPPMPNPVAPPPVMPPMPEPVNPGIPPTPPPAFPPTPEPIAPPTETMTPPAPVVPTTPPPAPIAVPQSEPQATPAATAVEPAISTANGDVFEGKGSGKYKVVVLKDKCIGAASCIAVSPSTFELNDQQIAKVLPTVTSETDENLLLAAQSCPTLAIEVYDTTTGEKVWPK